MDNQQDKKPLPSTLYTEDYFRSACEGFSEFNSSEGQQLSRRLNSAFALAEVRPGMQILDVGCGRGEILRHAAQLGANAYGIDYAAVAVSMSLRVIESIDSAIVPGRTGVSQADAKKLPFPNAAFDRVLMFDVVEHLHPWELHEALLEVRRVLKPDGRLIVHTAPNVWYDRYAYPLVRLTRRMMGQGDQYPKDPRQFLVSINKHVHVNEQSIWSMRQTLEQAGFKSKVWLESPPQQWGRSLLGRFRRFVFETPPFRWFFQREVFAVAAKSSG